MTDELRIPVEEAPVVTETPADAARGQGETPPEPAPIAPEGGKAPVPETPAPEGQDSREILEKRLKDTQKALSQKSQKVSDLEKLITPEVKAVIGEETTDGKEALRKLFEAHPELEDDPVARMEFIAQANQNQTMALMQAFKQQTAYAIEIKEMYPDIDLQDTKLDAVYWKVHKEYQDNGIKENPYIGAVAVVFPRKERVMTKPTPEEISERARGQLENPGSAPVPTAPKKEKVDINSPDYFRKYVGKKFPDLSADK